MNIIPSNCFNEQNLSTSVNKFFKTFQLSSILTICNCKKLKGINVMLLFSYILCNVFRDRSFYVGSLRLYSLVIKFLSIPLPPKIYSKCIITTQ